MKPILTVFPVTEETVAIGLTLRDYIAIAALKALINDCDSFWQPAVPLAYQYADAMLEERDK